MDVGLNTFERVAERCREVGVIADVDDRKRWLEVFYPKSVDGILVLTANPDGIKAFGHTVLFANNDETAVWDFVGSKVRGWKKGPKIVCS